MIKNLALLILAVLCVGCGGGSGGSSKGAPTPPGIIPGPPPTNSPLAVRLDSIQQGTVARDVYRADLYRLRSIIPGGVLLRWHGQYGDIVEIEVATTYQTAIGKSFNAEIAVNIGTVEYVPTSTSNLFFRPDCATAGYQPNAIWEVRGVSLGFYPFYGTACESFSNSPQPRNADGTYAAGIIRWRGVNPGQIAQGEIIFLPYKGS